MDDNTWQFSHQKTDSQIWLIDNIVRNLRLVKHQVVHMLKGQQDQQDHYISGVCLFKYVSWRLDHCLRWCPYLRVRRDHELVREWPVPRLSVCWYVCALCIQLLGVPTTIPVLRWGLFRLRNLEGETLSCTRETHMPITIPTTYFEGQVIK